PAGVLPCGRALRTSARRAGARALVSFRAPAAPCLPASRLDRPRALPGRIPQRAEAADERTARRGLYELLRGRFGLRQTGSIGAGPLMLARFGLVFALLLGALQPQTLSVKITSPLGRTGTSGTLRIVAQVVAPPSTVVKEVRFFVDGKLLGTDN